MVDVKSKQGLLVLYGVDSVEKNLCGVRRGRALPAADLVGVQVGVH